MWYSLFGNANIENQRNIANVICFLNTGREKHFWKTDSASSIYCFLFSKTCERVKKSNYERIGILKKYPFSSITIIKS